MATRIGGGLRTGVALTADMPARSATSRLTPLVAQHGWLAIPFFGAVASRIYSTLLLQVAAHLRHQNLFGPGGITESWDSRWYTTIASTGYHAAPLQVTALGGHHDYAFFPLWPIVIRVASLAGAPTALAAELLSPALFCVAAVLIALVLAPTFGQAVATDATLLLAFSPGAWTFSMGYSEGLFLVVAALAFLSTGPGRRGLVVLIAGVTRIAGLPLVAVDGLRFVRSRGRDRGALAVALLGAAGFAAWWSVVALVSGDPLGFLKGSPDWSKISGLGQVVAVVTTPRPDLLVQLLVFALVAVGGIVVLRRRWELGVFTLLTLALGLLPGGFVSSMPRYALAAFPGFAGLALKAGPRGSMVLILVSAVAQVALVAGSLTVHHRLAP
jgi:hypothetical protein